MNDYSHGPAVQGDANSSALLSHQRRQDKADLAYEEREASAPHDLYEDDARHLIMEALTGGKDDIDIIGCLAHRVEKDCGSLSDFVFSGVGHKDMIVCCPDHLTRLVQWTVQDLIKDWVAHRVSEYAEGE